MTPRPLRSHERIFKFFSNERKFPFRKKQRLVRFEWQSEFRSDSSWFTRDILADKQRSPPQNVAHCVLQHAVPAMQLSPSRVHTTFPLSLFLSLCCPSACPSSSPCSLQVVNLVLSFLVSAFFFSIEAQPISRGHALGISRCLISPFYFFALLPPFCCI